MLFTVLMKPRDTVELGAEPEATIGEDFGWTALEAKPRRIETAGVAVRLFPPATVAFNSPKSDDLPEDKFVAAGSLGSFFSSAILKAASV